MSGIDDCLKSVERLTRDRGEVMRAGDDKIAEIHRRHEFAGTHMRPAEFYWTIPGWIAHIDRAFLLAEVERLREVIRTIRARCVEMDDSDAVSETLDISSAALEDEP